MRLNLNKQLGRKMSRIQDAPVRILSIISDISDNGSINVPGSKCKAFSSSETKGFCNKLVHIICKRASDIFPSYFETYRTVDWKKTKRSYVILKSDYNDIVASRKESEIVKDGFFSNTIYDKPTISTSCDKRSMTLKIRALQKSINIVLKGLNLKEITFNFRSLGVKELTKLTTVLESLKEKLELSTSEFNRAAAVLRNQKEEIKSKPHEELLLNCPGETPTEKLNYIKGLRVSINRFNLLAQNCIVKLDAKAGRVPLDEKAELAALDTKSELDQAVSQRKDVEAQLLPFGLQGTEGRLNDLVLAQNVLDQAAERLSNVVKLLKAEE